jgi:cellulose 1,4-beta-cellobiosidase
MTSRWLHLSLLTLAAWSCTPHHKNAQLPSSAAPGTPSVAPTATVSSAPVVETPNPFDGAQLFVNPDYAAKVEAAAKADKTNAALIKKVASYPTAIWLDSIASVAHVNKALDAAEKQQAGDGKPVLAVFVVYDLPNRDCSAKASSGELDVDKGGEEKYKTEFIDKIAAQFAAHPKLRIVAIVEPDSLPNLATNMNVAKCAASDAVYRRATGYAVSKLNMPQVATYLDAAHAGWLGWEGNRQKIAKIYKDVLTQAGGADKLRGFATNVSNYNTVSGNDGKKLGPGNPCPDEGSYITKLTAALEAEGIRG